MTANFTYVGIQIMNRKRVKLAALLVNDMNGSTHALVYYNSRTAPVRIIYLED